MENFIVIGAKPVMMQALLSLHLYSDARCVLLCPNGTPYISLSVLCFSYIEIDFEGQDDARLIEIIKKLDDEMPNVTVVPIDCPGARMVDRIRPYVKARIAPAPTNEMLDCLEEKWAIYLFCKTFNLNVPLTKFIADKWTLNFPSIVKEIGLPFVIKPINEKASNGVHVIKSEEEYFDKVLHNNEYQFAPIIVQKYIDGEDVGLDLCSVKGKVTALAIQRRMDGEKWIEFFDNPYLRNVAYIVAESCKYDGLMNIDARIEKDSGNIYLLECNPRVWASMLASLWCGVNFLAEVMNFSDDKTRELKILNSGRADCIYYSPHPLLRRSIWRYVLFDTGHRGKMARIMAKDKWLMLQSLNELLKKHCSILAKIAYLAGDKVINLKNFKAAPNKHLTPPRT
jgi:predicted ATP-grasp superfamily ATP-dependent carboligase